MDGVVLIGRPGAGKSTLAHMLADFSDRMGLQLTYVGAGDIARDLASRDPAVAECLKEGIQAPECKMRTAIERALNQVINDGGTFITDGFPRDNGQYRWLRERFATMQIGVLAPREECIRRLLERGRYDDNMDVINNRMRFFEEQTLKIPMEAYHRVITTNVPKDYLPAMVNTIYTDIRSFKYHGWC